jgi:uncharacterized membrane protein YedE/YeeE
MKLKVWNPYLAGALTGVLLVLSVLVAGKFLGASTTFARGASVIEKAAGIDPAQFDYFTTKKGKYGPGSLPNWQLMVVLGIILGAFVSAKLSGDFKVQAVPDMWRQRFGGNPLKRAVVAFIGGVILLFGARLAGGCPSGHGLSGMAQLAVSGFIAMAFFFIGGGIIANLMYRGKEK